MLKVTAWLATPVAGDVPQLDALLEFEMAQRAGLANKLRSDLPAPQEAAVHIPMLRRLIGGRQVACCSAPLFRPRRTWRENVAKRLAVEHADVLSPASRRVVAMGNSVYKSYRLPLQIRDIERVVYLCAGHRRPVLKLLKSVSSLGRKRSVGYGRVAHWEAEEVPGEAWWFAASQAGAVLMRPLPLCDELPENLVGFRRDYGACTPPYWHPDRYTERVVPC